MGGDLGVHSRVGEGSTFWFELPLEIGEGPVLMAETIVTGELNKLNDLEVLVVDDNRVNLIVARAMREKFGCTVTTSENGKQALELYKGRHFDLVLMDCQMPVMDGYEATRRIREHESGGRRTPVIALTANAMPGDATRCLAAGMDAHLAKPVLFDDLEATLRQWASAPQVT